jgi:hypothetical protein
VLSGHWKIYATQDPGTDEELLTALSTLDIVAGGRTAAIHVKTRSFCEDLTHSVDAEYPQLTESARYKTLSPLLVPGQHIEFKCGIGVSQRTHALRIIVEISYDDLPTATGHVTAVCFTNSRGFYKIERDDEGDLELCHNYPIKIN